MKKRKFFKKIFIAYIGIIFVYTFIAVGFYFFKSNEINKYKIEDNQIVTIKHFRDKVDTSFNIATRLINQLAKDSEIVKYARNNEVDYYNVKKVYDTLNKNLNVFYDLGFTIAVSKLNDNLVITSSRSISLNKYLADRGLQQEKVREIKSFFSDEGLFYDIHYVLLSKNQEGQGIITLVNRQKPPYASDIYFFVTFYKKELFPAVNISGEGFAILRNGEYVAGTQGVDHDKILLPSDHEHVIDQEDGLKKIVNDLSIIYTVGSNSLRGWSYIYLTPRNFAHTNLNHIIILSSFIYSILAIIGLVISFLATRHIYKPIKGILNIFKGFGESDGDELSFIRESAYQIKLANDKLRETIKNNRLPLKTKFLSDLLYGLVSDTKIDQNLQKYDLYYLQGNLIVSILEFANYQELYDNFSKAAILNIVDQLQIIIREQLLQEIRCEVFELNYKRYAVIIPGNDSNKVRKILHRVLSQLESSFDLNIVAAVGQPVDSVYRLEESFNDALVILENRAATDKKLTIAIEDIPFSRENTYFYPLDFEKRLINFVLNGNKNGAFSTLNRLLDRNFKDKRINDKVLISFIISIVGTINRIYQQLDDTIKDLDGEGKLIYERLKTLDDPEDLRKKILDIFAGIIDNIQSVTKETERTFAGKLIDYIHENYNKDISLTDIAEEFNYSLGYISSLFKEHLNENYKDYLNKYRIKKAKELLQRNKKLKIKEVSKLVGCNNVNTFIRMFKRYEGISPGMYIDSI